MLHHHYHRDTTAEVIALSLLLLLLAAYLLWQGSKLVAETVVAHPSCRVLQGALGATLLAILAAIAFGAQVPALVAVAVGSVLVLVLVCRCVQLYYDPLQQRRITKEGLLEDVLQSAW